VKPRRFLLYALLATLIYPQVQYNHPEIEWQSFETEHFKIHFYGETETTAREGAAVAEKIYPHVTTLYQFEPRSKTHIVFLDTDDISNGASYYYDNKIYIWATPLDFELRGSHRWLQNVITHEFTHIISLQKAMKAGTKMPAMYFQWMGYEKERRKDVLYGYPNRLVSYPLPGTVVPPWLAEGVAQFMYEGANWDVWDTHRDMILRDRVLHGKQLSFTEMNTFGKKGIGNESVYNAGYAFCRYIAVKYGADKLPQLLESLSNPFQFSISKAIKQVLHVPAEELYNDFTATLQKRYETLSSTVRSNERKGTVLVSKGSANLYPRWSPDGNFIAFLSNQDNDYFGQTDLFLYDRKTKTAKKLVPNVRSAPSWNPTGKVIYYSRKPDFPDRHGSFYYDLYAYDLKKEKERRLTRDQRVQSPVFIPMDSSIVFLSTFDGGQNLYQLILKTRTIRKLTNFQDHRMLSSVTYDTTRHQLLFTVTQNHFRNIAYLSLEDSTLGWLLDDPEWDERDITAFGDLYIYSEDRSGIFNLYGFNPETQKQGYLTNVLGGAFMPHVNTRGEIVYSLYEDGGYKIALLDSLQWLEPAVVGYSPTYFRRNQSLDPPLVELDTTDAQPYSDQFPNMFVLPKLMVDYGTVKPGFFFYSTEILERLALFGMASVNQIRDVDFFFMFEYRGFYPTLFMEFYFLTRNVNEKYYYSVIPVDDRLKFQLLQFRGGMRFPLFGISELELYSIWQRYRAFVKDFIPEEQILQGTAYDYFQGLTGGIRWNLTAMKPRFDRDINPSQGFEVDIDMAYEDNHFIDRLDFSKYSTFVSVFKANPTLRFQGTGRYHLEIPHTKRWTITVEAQSGWMSNTQADSFFNFFGGGLEGIQGYPYYSIEGNRWLMGEVAFRVPLFRQRHYSMGWFILQNSVLGFLVQAGDAWNGAEATPQWKRSVGIQWRLNGFSFYNFPTAIQVELHRGLDHFTRKVFNQQSNSEDIFNYGQENRFYLSILFGF